MSVIQMCVSFFMCISRVYLYLSQTVQKESYDMFVKSFESVIRIHLQFEVTAIYGTRIQYIYTL